MSEPKHIDIAQFHRLGYLQEVNRQFFHPHGLALEIVVRENGEASLGGVWDYRDDPEGIVFDELNQADCERAKFIDAERLRHFKARAEMFGNDYALPARDDDVALPPDWPDVQPFDAP